MNRREFVKTGAILSAASFVPFSSFGARTAVPRTAEELGVAIDTLFPYRWDILQEFDPPSGIIHRAESSKRGCEFTTGGRKLIHETLVLEGWRRGMEADLCEQMYQDLLDRRQSGHDHLIWRVRPEFTEWEDHTIPDYSHIEIDGLENPRRKFIPAGTRLRLRLTTGTA